MSSLRSQVLTLLSITRMQNGLLVVLAQYLSALFILGIDHPIDHLLADVQLHILVLTSFLVVCGGYLINQYYDHPKDLINRPVKTVIDGRWTLSRIMRTYMVFNSIAFALSMLVSVWAAVFFTGYILTIWLYSHRLRSHWILGSLLSAFLSVSPIVVLFLYYRHFELLILSFAGFLFLMLWVIVLLKDLYNLPGDLAAGLRTMPTTFGEAHTVRLVIALLFLLSIIAMLLPFKADLGFMGWYFYSSAVLMIALSGFLLSLAESRYLKARFVLKVWVLSGTLSILFLDLDRLESLKALIFAF